MKYRILISGILILIVLGAVFVWQRKGTSDNISSEERAQKKLSVVTSFYPLYFFATEIAQGRADVVNITPAGAEPHDYEPTAQEVARIEKSDLLILNGGGLEAWGENIEKNIDSQFTRIVVAGGGLTTQKMVEEGVTMTDPHVWLSPQLSQKMVDNILQGFVQVDPENRNFYASNAVALKKELQALDQEYRRGLGGCVQKNIITSHTAFGYLAQTYGLKQIPITGLSPDAEPSTAELAEIVEFAKANNVKYIFFESLVSPKLAETVATEVGAQTLVLNPLEGLSNDEMASGKNYFTEMRSNLAHLKTALQCRT